MGAGTPLSTTDCTSLRKFSTERATPLPMMLVMFCRNTPLGSWCRANFPYSLMMVCPALLPPWNRTTMSESSASTSVIFPLPSSPQQAPTIALTITLHAFLNDSVWGSPPWVGWEQAAYTVISAASSATSLYLSSTGATVSVRNSSVCTGARPTYFSGFTMS